MGLLWGRRGETREKEKEKGGSLCQSFFFCYIFIIRRTKMGEKEDRGGEKSA